MNRNNQRRALLKGKALPLLKKKDLKKNVLVFRKSRIISKTFIIFAGESLFLMKKVCYNKQSAFMDLSNISVYR